MTNFADQFAVEFIRVSLWRDGGSKAAVMVGAGFSRNANKGALSAKPMPTWPQMSESLCRLLYANLPEASFRYALRDASSTSGFLRLAQEYKAVFGQGALNEQIRALVPDLEYEPGELHNMLLELPWTDVLTTNWDTLLERSSRDVFNIKYDVIRTHSEIPSSTRPRIVKLHGTLPAHEPLIFTEDDYRTYPSSQAPFVNLVQQTLMESVLCLIGFSGDDPNFLHWSGWVRDNLGDKAPKIYLVGWLELSPARRKLLEARNVVPVDLSTLDAAKSWKKEERHHHATEWFLRSISLPPRFSPSEWPDVSHGIPESPAYLGQILSPAEKLPKAEDAHPPHNMNQDGLNKIIPDIIDTWSWNRSLYPGWCIAPNHIRGTIWHQTWSWINPISKYQVSCNPLVYLRTLEQLLWRLDLAFSAYFIEIVGPVELTLNSFDFDAKSIKSNDDQNPSTEKPDWPELKSTWVRVAFYMVRYHRSMAELAAAEAWLERIRNLNVFDKELLDEVAYEQLLIYRDYGFVNKLESGLHSWDVSQSDVIWAARKAGLLCWLGYSDEAEVIVKGRLAETRKHCRRDIVDYASLSREAWLLWIEDTLRYGRDDGKKSTVAKTTSKKRREVLSNSSCDMQTEFGSLVNSLMVAISKDARPSYSDFYRTESVSYSFSNGIADSERRAFEIYQFSEKTGLPRAINSVSVLGNGMRLAIEELAKSEPWAAAMMSVRGGQGSSDEAIKYWTRDRIASLSDAHYNALYKLVSGEIDFALKCSDEKYVKNWSSRLQISLEILTRLSVRCKNDESDELLTWTCQLLLNRRCQRDMTISSNLGKLLTIAMRVTPPELLGQHAVELFSMPINIHPHFPEPANLWPRSVQLRLKNKNIRQAEWSRLIGDLTKEFRSKNEDTVYRSASRLSLIYEFGLMTSSEIKSISDILWNSRNKKISNWPKIHNFHPWGVLSLPCSMIQKRDDFLKSHFLSDNSSYKKVAVVGLGRHNLKVLGQNLTLSSENLASLRQGVKLWSDIRPSIEKQNIPEFFRANDKADEQLFVKGLLNFLPELGLSRDEASAVLDKISLTYKENPLALKLLPAILFYLPHEFDFICNLINKALASDNKQISYCACEAIWEWVNPKGSCAGKLEAPSKLLPEIGRIISTRKISALTPAIELAKLVIYNLDDSARNMILKDIEEGLYLLIDEAKYFGSLSNQGVDISSLRAAIIGLVVAIKSKYHGEPEIFSEWLKIAEEDNLTEVRRALTTGNKFISEILI